MPWQAALWHRPLLPIAAAVVAGCAAGPLWLRPALSATRAAPWLDAPLVVCLAMLIAAIVFLMVRGNKPPGQPAVNSVGALLMLLAVGCAMLSARRGLPPSGDVSALVRSAPPRSQPLSPTPSSEEPSSEEPSSEEPAPEIAATLSGWVADYPRSGDFGTEFPFQIADVRDATAATRKRAAQKTSAAFPTTAQSTQATAGAAADAGAARAATSTAGAGPLAGRVWVRLPPEARVEVGDALRLRARLTDLPRPGNPGERSLQARYIEQSCWCLARVRAAEDWSIMRRGEKFSLARRIATLRRRLLSHYERAFAPPEMKTAAMPEKPESRRTVTRSAHARNEVAPAERVQADAVPGEAASPEARPYPYATAQLLAAMVFGEGGLREPLPRLTRDRFRAAGLSHVLVASGTQVAFLALMLIGAARLLGLRRWWLLLAVLPALLLYALIAGGAASIWRATVAGACLAWALLLGRDVDGLSLWSLALVVLLLGDPAQLHNLGFQLTFAATWGLLALAPWVRRILARGFGNTQPRVTNEGAPGASATPASGTGSVDNANSANQNSANANVTTAHGAAQNGLAERGTARHGGNFWLDLASLSLGAQLATTPLLLYHFGRISVAGIGANFIGVPLAGALVATGMLGLVVPPANALNYYLVRFLDDVAGLAARPPGAQTDAPPLSLSWTVACYALLLVALAHSHFVGPGVGQNRMQRFAQRLAHLLASGGWRAAWNDFQHAARDGLERRHRRWRRRRGPWRPQSFVVALAIAFTLWAGWRVFLARPAALRVAVLDVGQGESIIIQSAAGRTVLIDGGTSMDEGRGEVGRAVIVPYLQSIGVRRLDAMILTHADADHCNGLKAVLREVPVALAIDGAAARTELEGRAPSDVDAASAADTPS